MLDVLIVGGGPAGLSAALMLGRSGRAVLVLDAGAPRNAAARQIHNLLTRDSTEPAEYRRIAVQDLARYPSVTLRRAEVLRVQQHNPVFAAKLSNGEVLRARRVLLATGLTDDLPQLPGMAELWGTSVFHCPYCHGWETTGKTVAVQGAGPARVRLALQLTRFSTDLVLCTDGESLDPASMDALRAAGVAVRTEPITELLVRDGLLHGVRFTQGNELPRQAFFVQSATHQHSPLADELGCAVLPDGGIEVDEFGRTSVPGVYAAGDMAHRPTLPMPLSSVNAATTAGQVAAAGLDQELLSEDFGLPNPLTASLRRPPASSAAGTPPTGSPPLRQR